MYSFENVDGAIDFLKGFGFDVRECNGEYFVKPPVKATHFPDSDSLMEFACDAVNTEFNGVSVGTTMEELAERMAERMENTEWRV